MGFQYSSLQSTEVTISGGVTLKPFINQPTIDQTLRHAYITADGNNQTIYTVTAGKTFYLMGIILSSQAVGGTRLWVYENDGSTIIAVIGAYEYRADGMISAVCPLHAYTSEQNVVVKSSNNNDISIWGYEA